jgi:serine/threonine protein kinase
LDLKPENIQIGPFGEVVVCDWGLGKKLQDHEQPSWSQQIDTPNAEVEINPSLYGEIKGTPGFMAPEQIKKGGAKTEQTDIYALGCLLHLILIGRLPHRGDVPDLMHKTVHKEISLPPKLDLSDGLKSILMKCLNKEPELRYDAVITLKKDLEQSVGGYSTSAQNATLITEIKLFAKRNRFIIRVVMGFILMVSLGLLFFNHRLQRSQAKTQSAEKQARSAEEQAQSLTAVIMEKKEWRITETIAKSKLYSHDQFFRNPKKNIYKALKVLKGSLHIEHNLHFAHECMAELHFLCQNFSKARVHYEKSEHPPSSILKLCRRFAKLPKKSSELLSFEHFNELILQLSHNEWNHFLIERMIAYDQQQRPQGQHYLEAVKATFLSMVFGEITDFDFDREHKHLKIEGSGVKSLLSSNKEASGLSILRFLNPLSLDLSQTRFHSIPELKGFEQLRELNIRNTDVKEVSALNRFHILKVHINEGQLDKEQKQGLGGWIELIEEL